MEEAAPAPLAPPLTELRLAPFRIEGVTQFEPELRGLLTASFELGLYDIPGVIPKLSTNGPALAIELAASRARSQADLRLLVRARPESKGAKPNPLGPLLSYELEICPAGQACATWNAEARQRAPTEAVALLLGGVADTLGQPVPESVRLAWATPGSRDAYAELITGRSAAIYHAYMPIPEGDVRAGVLRRAVNIDPKQALAWWLLARWDLGANGDADGAVEGLARASLERPDSALLLADRAHLLDSLGKADQALLLWESIAERWPDDPRFLEARARALFAVGRAQDSRSLLRRLPAEFNWDPSIAALTVTAEEAVAGPAGLDPLLAHWERTDSRRAEPTRRRINLRVQRHDYADALTHVPSLRSRAPGPETDALEVALLVAQGRLQEAANRAPDDVARRIRARASWEIDPGAEPPIPDATLATRLAELEAALWRGDVEVATSLSESLLAEAPDRATTWIGRAKALEQLGRLDEAGAAWQEAWERDPAAEGGPVLARQVAPTMVVRFNEVEAGLSAPTPLGPAL